MKLGPTGIIIGDTEIVAYYGIILMLGAFAGAWLASREAKRRGLDPELVWDGLIWVLIGGVVGARLWHIFTPPPSMIAAGYTTHFYLTHPLDLINTRQGGLGIPGAIIGGGLALYLFCRRKNFSFGLWADIAAPGLALGQVIGRWGNFINQEVYGAQTDLPWGIYIQREGAKFHPLFLYESLWNLVNMILLLWLGRRHSDKLKDGDLLLTYLIVYPTGRFLLEFLRLDSAMVAGININQITAAVVAIIAAGFMFWRHRPRQVNATEVQPASKE